MNDIVKMLRECSSDEAYLSRQAADEITRLRAENFSLASWQCEFTDGKTGLVSSEGGSTYCAMAKRVEALRAEVEWLMSVVERVYQSSAQKHIIELTRAALEKKR